MKNFVTFVFVAIVLIAMFGSSGSHDSTPSYSNSPSTSSSASSAESACKNAVRGQLKAPSTAKFSDVDSSGAGVNWSVTGSVDSENGFGAMLRSSFICSVDGSGAKAAVF